MTPPVRRYSRRKLPKIEHFVKEDCQQILILQVTFLCELLLVFCVHACCDSMICCREIFVLLSFGDSILILASCGDLYVFWLAV